MSAPAVDSDSESDSDLEGYKDIAGNFFSMVNQLKEKGSHLEATPKKRKIPSPEKKNKEPEDLNESINLDTDDTNSSEPNLESTNRIESNIDDSAANLSTSVVEDSPIFIEDDEDDEDEVDEVDLNTRLSRLRPRSGGRVLPSRGRKKTKKTKTKQSPNKKKKIIEYDFSLLEDNDDSLNLSHEKDTQEDANPSIEVKVYWRFKKLDKVPVRKFQKIAVIFEHFAKEENVPESRIQLCLDQKILKPDDTPDSLNLKISDILDGGILNEETSDVPVTNGSNPAPVFHEESADSIPIKIIRKDIREPLIIKIKKTDKMMILIVKVGEELNLKQGEFKLFFDGEAVDPEDSPDSLDLEGNECFDLKIKS
nr:PREDICTED: NFATC2-interacting protein isoform X1 [Bemisia tabaci]